jgi:hypothetical protein
MEAGDRSVSIDLLMKALVTLGATPSDVGKPSSTEFPR